MKMWTVQIRDQTAYSVQSDIVHKNFFAIISRKRDYNFAISIYQDQTAQTMQSDL